MRGSRRRLDAELVRRGLVASRERAREAVAAGQVTVNGAVAQKAARLVLPGDALELLGPPARYVSRGGEKLEGALEAFGLDVAGLRCCDVGASTGGFTDCLLQRGAAEVVAVDVGRAQMHERLADDSRVTLHERTDIRDVDPVGVGAPFDLV
ncbi:MAG: TlyA family RNA methyltransferase, partial [Acidimicrobiia bacterium]|nr:TlyA family RNA methyltransferase [Acidimicrobiia bacterium]